MKIFLRDLKPDDANISWKWRNDPEIWKLTGRRWDGQVTKEIERLWIREVVKRKDEKRFAICLHENQKYVGNVQLTGITAEQAFLHIFIGDKDYWGMGIATEAVFLVQKFGFHKLNLKRIFLKVKNENTAAIRVYQRSGFRTIKYLKENILMEQEKDNFMN